MPAVPLFPARPARPRFQRLRVIAALALRGMDTRFGRSAGGYLWAVAEPLGGIVLLALVFSLAVRSPPIGTSFMLFYATGIIPFRMFNSMSGAVSSAISANRGLLAYPVVKPLDAVFARFALNFMTDFLVATLLFVGIIRFSAVTVNLDLAAVAGAFTLTALLGLGIGTLNCVLFGLFPTWKNFWSVLTRPLFFLSGIFFLFEAVPLPFRDFVWYNPIVHLIGMMRAGFYGSYHADYVSVPYVLGIAGTSFVLGGYLLRRHAPRLIEGD
jgi:capsular polysaccharide transport system permease protein